MKLCRIKYHLILTPFAGLFLLFSSCADSSRSSNELEEIDLYGAYRERSEVPVSNIASGIEYIRLESGEEFMLNDPHLVNVKDSLILFIGFQKLYIFSRYTGEFLYEISSYGRGPDQYLATTSIYDEDEDIFYVNFGNKRRDVNNNNIFRGYNFSGEVVRTVSRPCPIGSEGNLLFISRFWPLNDTLCLGYIDNPEVNQSEKLVVFSNNGKSLKFYPNYNIYNEDNGVFSFEGHKGMFFNAEDTVRFFELHTDTIFSVSSCTIQPRYHIIMGDLLLPYQLRAAKFSEYLNYFHIRNMHESSRFLMFSAGIYGTRHIVIYDKIQKRTMVCDTPDDHDFYKFEDYYGIRCIGFSNDLDNFIPIGTDKHFYINKDDEFVTAIPALEVRRWFERNPEKAALLPDHLMAFRNIQDEDNPVIVIAKLKK
ncbi:MAG: 6-bladed beta-propeller [Bacteroidales bacterium]|nr:6-bladed beta-propeller [Bacteroidales bacterium]